MKIVAAGDSPERVIDVITKTVEYGVEIILLYNGTRTPIGRIASDSRDIVLYSGIGARIESLGFRSDHKGSIISSRGYRRE